MADEPQAPEDTVTEDGVTNPETEEGSGQTSGNRQRESYQPVMRRDLRDIERHGEVQDAVLPPADSNEAKERAADREERERLDREGPRTTPAFPVGPKDKADKDKAAQDPDQDEDTLNGDYDTQDNDPEDRD